MISSNGNLPRQEAVSAGLARRHRALRGVRALGRGVRPRARARRARARPALLRALRLLHPGPLERAPPELPQEDLQPRHLTILRRERAQTPRARQPRVEQGLRSTRRRQGSTQNIHRSRLSIKQHPRQKQARVSRSN